MYRGDAAYEIHYDCNSLSKHKPSILISTVCSSSPQFGALPSKLCGWDKTNIYMEPE